MRGIRSTTGDAIENIFLWEETKVNTACCIKAYEINWVSFMFIGKIIAIIYPLIKYRNTKL